MTGPSVNPQAALQCALGKYVGTSISSLDECEGLPRSLAPSQFIALSSVTTLHFSSIHSSLRLIEYKYLASPAFIFHFVSSSHRSTFI